MDCVIRCGFVGWVIHAGCCCSSNDDDDDDESTASFFCASMVFSSNRFILLVDDDLVVVGDNVVRFDAEENEDGVINPLLCRFIAVVVVVLMLS